MPRYFYTGIQTAIALPPKAEGEKPVDVRLIPNTEVELPADMAYVQRLVREGTLTPIEPPKPTRTRSSKAEADS